MFYTLIIICFLTGIAVFDLKTYRIPDVLLLLFAFVVIILEGWQPYTFFFLRLFAAVLSFLLFGIVWYFSRGIGFGDVKYACLLGYLLGPEKLVFAFVITAFLGIVVYLTVLFFFRWSKTKKIPYAPFLSAGAVASILINQNISGGIT